MREETLTIGRALRLAIGACVMIVALPTYSAARDEPSSASTALTPDESMTILHFELKLYVRRNGLLRRAAIDQWSGGRLLMTRRASENHEVYLLVRPLEDPWTLRWYPALDEVKLGAAVNVTEPRGDPYGALAGPLTAIAETKYAEWWDGGDVVTPTVDLSPSWSEETNRFWLRLHRAEADEKDDLPQNPVYPFYVLGDPEGRIEFSVLPSGRVPRDSIFDRMSEPWLPDGWREWQRGNRQPGYGFWETQRPRWEPRTYPALATALELLGWSPLPSADHDGVLPDDEASYDLRLDPARAFDFPAAMANVIAALNPRFSRALDWRGGLDLHFEAHRTSDGALVVRGESGRVRLPADDSVVLRVWRYARYDMTLNRWVADELQALVTDELDRLKIWVRVGYLPDTNPTDTVSH